MARLMVSTICCCLLLMLISCKALTEKRIYRIGLPKKVSTLAPYFYQNYLPKNIKISMMPLNDANQLKTALLVEAVDLAILPISVVLEEHGKTKQIQVISSIVQDNQEQGPTQTILVLVAKKSFLEKYKPAVDKIIAAHRQAVDYLNSNHQAWQEQAIALKLEKKSVKEQIAQTKLMHGLDQKFQQRIQGRANYLIETGVLKQELDYQVLWYKINK